MVLRAGGHELPEEDYKGELLCAMGGIKASASLLGVPLGHNSSFLQGPAFAPSRIREAILRGSTNSTTEEGKELNDPRVLTDAGDVPIQEIHDCSVQDERLMHVISESVKTVIGKLGLLHRLQLVPPTKLDRPS